MPFNGSGTYVPPSAPTFPAIGGQPILALYYNAVVNDMATALSNCLAKDGQSSPSAAISWNSQNLTGVGNLTSTTATITTLTTTTMTFGTATGLLLNCPIQMVREASKTIASDAVAVTSADYHFALITEGAAATDDLVNITGGTTGQMIVIRSSSSGQAITLKTTGNIAVPYDVVLAGANKVAVLIYDGAAAAWVPAAIPDGLVSATVPGLAPLSGGGTTNFLRADGTWAAPATSSLNILTINSGGAGAASPVSFDGSAAKTISYNTIGATRAGAVTSGDLTMSTSRLLGRTTALTGPVGEISVGATLSLAAGSLDVLSVPNSLTFNNSGAGAASGSTFNGTAAKTISYDTIGAAPSSPSIQSVASSATVTPTFSNDQVNITALASNLTLANPTGTAVDGWAIIIRIKDAGVAKTIGYGTKYRAIGVTLPTTTVVSKTVYLGMIYNSADTKWDVVMVQLEA